MARRWGQGSDAATGWAGLRDIYPCNANYEALGSMHERSIRGCLAVRRGALRRTGQSGHLRLGDQDGLGLPVRIDAPIGAEKPIPEIVDYRKIAIGIPVVEKMELLLSPEPGKSSQP